MNKLLYEGTLALVEHFPKMERLKSVDLEAVELFRSLDPRMPSAEELDFMTLIQMLPHLISLMHLNIVITMEPHSEHHVALAVSKLPTLKSCTLLPGYTLSVPVITPKRSARAGNLTIRSNSKTLCHAAQRVCTRLWHAF